MLLLLATLLGPYIFMCRWLLAATSSTLWASRSSSPAQDNPTPTHLAPIWPLGNLSRQWPWLKGASDSLSNTAFWPFCHLLYLQTHCRPHPQRLQLSQAPELWVTHTVGGSPSPPAEASFLGSWGQRTQLRAWQWRSKETSLSFSFLWLFYMFGLAKRPEVVSQILLYSFCKICVCTSHSSGNLSMYCICASVEYSIYIVTISGYAGDEKKKVKIIHSSNTQRYLLIFLESIQCYFFFFFNFKKTLCF